MSKVLPLYAKRRKGDGQSDTALLAGCADGDMSALGELFGRYCMDVYGFVSRLSGADDAELDDLVQNTFLIVQKSAGKFRNQSSVRSWLFGIASNIVKHHIRSDCRRKAALQAFHQVLDATPGPSGVHEIVERKVMIARLAAALEILSFKLRVVFVMCDVEGIPGTEAAKTLGIREGTLWRRLHDARKKLAAEIERSASQ